MTQTRSDKPDAARRAGVCLHISALPGPYGIGSIGADARQFVDRLAQMNMGVWQFLPTGPTGYGNSPYQPLSTFAGNELLVDVADLVDPGLLDDAAASGLRDLPGRWVDFDQLIPRKNALLTEVARRFDTRANAALRVAYDEFRHANDDLWLHDYALFRALKSQHDERAWPEWDKRFVHREQKALANVERAAAERIAATKIAQFLFHRQWQSLSKYAHERGVQLFGDLPIYVALDSADAWVHRDILDIDDDGIPSAVSGVPPDYFSEDGQLWGNPLYDWKALDDDGYRWWIDRMRAATAQWDLVRIDHFRGFAAYWSVPADATTARDGAWVPGPADAVFDAMRAALGRLPIVAEDLGEITEDVYALRDRLGFPGMRVLQFDAAADNFNPESIPAHCACYTGTHDNDTTLGWIRGSPNDVRNDFEIEVARRNALRVTGGSEDTIHRDLHNLALQSAANLAIAPLQDLLGLGSEARFNTPGTAEGNWRWRATAAELNTPFCDAVAKRVSDAGR